MQWYSSRLSCSNSSLLKICVDHKSWEIPRALPFLPCFRKSAFSFIFHGNLLCHCRYSGRHSITMNVLTTVGKTETMSVEAHHANKKGTKPCERHLSNLTKQLKNATLSVEWLPCLCIDAASYHEVCKSIAIA